VGQLPIADCSTAAAAIAILSAISTSTAAGVLRVSSITDAAAVATTSIMYRALGGRLYYQMDVAQARSIPLGSRRAVVRSISNAGAPLSWMTGQKKSRVFAKHS